MRHHHHDHVEAHLDGLHERSTTTLAASSFRSPPRSTSTVYFDADHLRTEHGRLFDPLPLVARQPAS